jgi:hypothetical protein
MGNYYYFNIISAVDKADEHPWKWVYDNDELVSLTVPYYRITGSKESHWVINDLRKSSAP